MLPEDRPPARVPSSPSALDALRLATRSLHERLEGSLRITAPGAGLEDYRQYLVSLWGWHVAVEERLWEQAWPPAMQAARRRTKLDRMARDLHHLGIDDAARAALPRMQPAPALDDEATRYGVAYVIEGSQLGVRALGRSLAPRLGGWEPVWLQGYGADTAQQWKNFIGCLEAAVTTEAQRRRAASAAAAAFESLAAWIETGGSASPGGNARLSSSGLNRVKAVPPAPTLRERAP